MSSLDLDLDFQISSLEAEWRRAYDVSILARSDYQALAASSRASAAVLEAAGERVERAEALKARIMAKIECLEDRLLGKFQP